MKHMVTIKVGNRSYRGRIVKITAEGVESFYKLDTNFSDNTDDGFAHKYVLEPIDIVTRFGNGKYKFTSSYCDFKICWTEFMDKTYKGRLSDFDHELKLLNHNRMQIHQISTLKAAINVLNNQRLNHITKMIKEALFTNSNVQHIRDIHSNVTLYRNKILKKNSKQ